MVFSKLTFNPLAYYIGYTADTEDRNRASSGGIGTAIVRHLLSLPEFGTSITFEFDQKKCMYVPKLIYSSYDINVCGSIYQDIDIVRFLRENLDNIKNGVVVTCTPCQVAAVRQLLTKNKIHCFILSFSCSGQTVIEGTWKYYELLGIQKEDVVNMQYRGNGWPSGIQIELKNGHKIYKDNYTEPWKTLHKSKLYTPKRCLYCKRDTGYNADIALADPWLQKFLHKDKLGHTLCIPFSEKGLDLLQELQKESLVHLEKSSYNDYAVAQKPNIQKEVRVNKEKNY